MFGVIFVFAELIIPRQAQTGRECLSWLYALFLGFAALSYVLRYFGIPPDRSTGGDACRGLSLWPTTVSWTEISSCDLVVVRDTFGEIAFAYPVMKDSQGKDLFPGLAANLGWASREDQLRVLQILKRRFPKLDLDPWEL